MTALCYDKGRAWIELNMENLRHNVNILRSMLPPGCELMPAVKADAYGHGAVPVARELNKMGVRAFCVATVAEGATLRRHGIRGLILILGYTHPHEFELLTTYELTQTVIDFSYAKLLNGYHRPIQVHIAVDTGMHRIGERCENVEHFLEMFRMENLKITGLYTHLCTADSENDEDKVFTARQAQSFRKLVQWLDERGYSVKAHILSSYGLIKYPEYGGDYARVGIALFGLLSTDEDTRLRGNKLRPVLSVKARVVSIRKLHTGESAGYGLAYIAKKDTQIAALSVGYADGLPRALSCEVGSVLLNGRKAPIIGRICMDQTLVDISGIPSVNTGDTAVMIGRSDEQAITACDVAKQADTITNEILSRLSQRLTRVIVNQL